MADEVPHATGKRSPEKKCLVDKKKAVRVRETTAGYCDSLFLFFSFFFLPERSRTRDGIAVRIVGVQMLVLADEDLE